jgi:hypothetical protein
MATREAIMTALQARITGAIASSFVGNATGTNPQITGIASTAKLFAGLPAVGGTVPEGTFIQTVDSANAVTLTQAPTTDGAGVTFLTGFQTVGRRVIRWSEISAQPALFLVNASEQREVRSGLPPKRTMYVELMIYSDSGKNANFAPGITLNNFADAIEAALQPDNILQNVQTLGGLVAHARLEDAIDFYPGDLGSQAIALLHVAILLP